MPTMPHPYSSVCHGISPCLRVTGQQKPHFCPWGSPIITQSLSAGIRMNGYLTHQHIWHGALVPISILSRLSVSWFTSLYLRFAHVYSIPHNRTVNDPLICILLSHCVMYLYPEVFPRLPAPLKISWFENFSLKVLWKSAKLLPHGFSVAWEM